MTDKDCLINKLKSEVEKLKKNLAFKREELQAMYLEHKEIGRASCRERV